MKILIILVFGALIILSYKPRKVKEVKVELVPVYYKLTKVDAG